MKTNSVKRKMMNAIVSLLGKKQYLQITVTDLIKEAGIARGSFYRTYNSVDELLDDVILELGNTFLNLKVEELIKFNKKEELKSIIAYYLKELKSGTVPFSNLLPENRHIIVGKLELLYNKYLNLEFKNLDEKYLPFISLSSLYSAAIIWSKYGFKESPEEVADYICEKVIFVINK